jgi:ubiquinone/menaquinone biosynthesis C-methylase UbiE
MREGVNLDEQARVTRVYERYARSARKRRAWAAEKPGNRAIREELLSHVTDAAAPWIAKGGDVLDVGCGTGWLLRALAAMGVAAERLHGVDLLEGRLRQAAAALPGADLRVADARGLPYPADRFQLVLLLTCLSSLDSRAAVLEALREARRVTAPGALLLCYEPRIANPLNRDNRLVRRRDYESVLGRDLAWTSLTLAPPIARRLGGWTERLYPRLARARLLRTHRLVAAVRS